MQRGHTRCGSPGRETEARTLSRVRFLGAGLVGAAGALGGYAAQAQAAGTTQVWRLDPYLECGTPGAGCSGCKACRAHAANKLFASAAAAEANRAHTYCKCRVVPFANMDDGTYNALFVDGGARPSVDLRRQWVQAVLAQAPVALALMPAALPLAADGPARAVARDVFMRRKTNGSRWLYVDVEAAGAVTVTIAIMRDKRILAARTVSGPGGRKRRKLEIPRDVKAGPARMRVTMRNSRGHADFFTRAIQIPKVWPVGR